jgi:hypothetical protein
MPGRNRDDRYLSSGAPMTFVDRVRPDGSVVRWGSRPHRKHQQPAAGSTWWAPRARGWWIAVLFAIGSLLFGLGAVPGYASAVGARWDTVTYFAGSLFFTAASFLSYREAVDAAPEGLNPAHRRFFTYQPGRIDWWATAVQFAGTLYFNVSCGVAMASDLSAATAHQHVWRPDAIGSVCFLVSSLLSWYEACHGWAAWRPTSYAWWITLVNLIGSIAFGISAVAGYINPVSGQVHNAARANTQTLIGAICFLIGAVLLLPERTEEPAATQSRASTIPLDRSVTCLPGIPILHSYSRSSAPSPPLQGRRRTPRTRKSAHACPRRSSRPSSHPRR